MSSQTYGKWKRCNVISKIIKKRPTIKPVFHYKYLINCYFCKRIRASTAVT